MADVQRNRPGAWEQNKLKAPEFLGVLLRLAGIYCVAGVASDTVHLIAIHWNFSWTPGDTWQKATAGLCEYASYATVLLFRADRIVRALYRTRHADAS